MKQTPTFVIEPGGIKAKQMFLSSDSHWGGWVATAVWGIRGYGGGEYKIGKGA